MTDVMVVDVGTRACLVEVDDAVAAASLASWVRAAGLPAEEVVPAARTVLLDGVNPAAVRELLPRWAARRAAPPGPLVRVAVRYSGPDLARVADHWGCTTQEVVDLDEAGARPHVDDHHVGHCSPERSPAGSCRERRPFGSLVGAHR